MANINLNFKKNIEITMATRLLLLLVSFVLSWKLLRLAYPAEILWNIHNYVIIFLAFISIILSIKHNLYLEKSKTAIIVLSFVLLSVGRLGFFPYPDPFFIASMVFCLYFSMLTIFMRFSIEYGFKCFEILLVLLLIYNSLDYFDANSALINIFSYEIPAFMDGLMNPLGHESQTIFSQGMSDGFIIRSVGVAGTNYASSALTAATAIYFYILKRRTLFSLSFLLLILWGVGSSIMAALVYILFLKRKSKALLIFIPLGIALAYLVITSRGFNSDVYLNITNNFGTFDFLLASIIGEGKSVSSLHTEFRILGLFFSLGFLGAFLVSIMIINYRNFAHYARLNNIPNFDAGLGFILVLLIATAHYNSLFVFPNIFLIVMLIALSSIGFMKIPKYKQSSVISNSKN
tara:strand:- start:13919 stop:15130 length:1212 start_codon:yes stop_codon:yes gene_type:complete